jgi:hypothetical protein
LEILWDNIPLRKDHHFHNDLSFAETSRDKLVRSNPSLYLSLQLDLLVVNASLQIVSSLILYRDSTAMQPGRQPGSKGRPGVRFVVVQRYYLFHTHNSTGGMLSPDKLESTAIGQPKNRAKFEQCIRISRSWLSFPSLAFEAL